METCEGGGAEGRWLVNEESEPRLPSGSGSARVESGGTLLVLVFREDRLKIRSGLGTRVVGDGGGVEIRSLDRLGVERK